MALSPGGRGVTPGSTSFRNVGPLLWPGGMGVTPISNTEVAAQLPDSPIIIANGDATPPGVMVDNEQKGRASPMFAGGEAPPGTLSKQQSKSVPIRVFNRKVFVTAGDGTIDANGLYKSEPIKVEGFQRMDYALTIHGMSRNTTVHIEWEHAGIPETQHSDNWTTVGLAGTQNFDYIYSDAERGKTFQLTLKEFLPYLRLTVNIQVAILGNIYSEDTVQSMFAEISLTGHLHEKLGDA